MTIRMASSKTITVVSICVFIALSADFPSPPPQALVFYYFNTPTITESACCPVGKL